jgi:SAM-dependent methyltransferase
MSDNAMADPATFQPRRFRTTAGGYARFRLGYPDALIRRVAAMTGLAPGAGVLDLGCGPGLLALPFARAGMAVTAVDPEPEMLEALKESAKTAGLTVRALAGSSFDMPPGIGPFRAVVMGRAFHWTDRAATAKALDTLVEPGGALVLFDDLHLDTVENQWRTALERVAARYGADTAPHRRERADPRHRSHESILLDSPFPVLETAGVVVARELTVDDIVGYAFSLSVTSRQALGVRAAEFESELRDALALLSPSETFRELAEMKALVATRA